MINNKVAIVTGGSGGIGAAIVKAMGKNEYYTVIIYNNNEKNSLMLQKEVKNSLAIKCDVSSEPDVKEMMTEVMESMGRIDVLINGASPPINYSRFIEKDIKFSHGLESRGCAPVKILNS